MMNNIPHFLEQATNGGGRNKESKIRFFHASSESPKVMIYMDNKYKTNLLYMTSSEYFSLPPGKHQLEVLYSEGKTIKKLNESLSFQPEQIYTYVLFNFANKLEICSFLNDANIPVGESKIRFLHLKQDAPIVDIAVKNRDTVFERLSFMKVTEYLGITPMTIDLEIRESGTKKVIYSIPKAQFNANEVYTIAIAGNVNEKMEIVYLKD
ncbi:MAG: DUF4397 domain-containing protein [Bacillota bacterium]|nr:DUF4397 domain-containing protein [Bacillota bacterium]